MQGFIGKPLLEVEGILKAENKDYHVIHLSGGKDADLLQEAYIVRVKERPEGLELVVTGFKTTM